MADTRKQFRPDSGTSLLSARRSESIESFGAPSDNEADEVKEEGGVVERSQSRTVSNLYFIFII